MSLNSNEIKRYARHISLPEIGISGQNKLKDSSILCIGSGGLGSPLLIYLAAAGVGNIGIVDYDKVEDSNLQRQIIHSTKSLNKSKAKSAKNRILDLNQNCKVNIYETMLNNDNALKIIKEFDIICDCTDNFPSRYLINDACVILGKPNIYGSISEFEGQASVFNLTLDSPNYRDLVPEPPTPGMIPSCAEGGVIGVLPGLIGIIQATEAIKIITGIGDILDGRLLVFNALKMRFQELKLRPNGGKEAISGLIDYEKFCNGFNEKSEAPIAKEISAKELKEIFINKSKNLCLLDVRNPDEYKINSIKGAKLFPLKRIEEEENILKIKKLMETHDLCFYCKSGKRSKQAIYLLKKHGISGINLNGGIDGWEEEVSN